MKTYMGKTIYFNSRDFLKTVLMSNKSAKSVSRIAGSQKESGMSVISTLGTEHERWV